MVSTLHFSGWNFMSHFDSHSASLSRSCWRFAASASDDIVTYAMVSNYTLHGHILEHDTSAKYLGCTISSDLKWGKHISTICSKANNTISFLKRTINISNTSASDDIVTYAMVSSANSHTVDWIPSGMSFIGCLESESRTKKKSSDESRSTKWYLNAWLWFLSNRFIYF
jgi:hypothetical protein